MDKAVLHYKNAFQLGISEAEVLFSQNFWCNSSDENGQQKKAADVPNFIYYSEHSKSSHGFDTIDVLIIGWHERSH